MLDQRNNRVLLTPCQIFSQKFVICSVSTESLIKSLKVSPMILTHQVVEYKIDLTKGTFPLLKPTIYPDLHDLV